MTRAKTQSPLPPRAAPNRPTPPVPKVTFGRIPENTGHRMVLFGPGGIGKTTLAATAPGPVAFFDLDDSLSRLRDQLPDGVDVRPVEGVTGWADIRKALHAEGWGDVQTVVVDSATKAEELAVAHTLATVPHEKGHRVDRIEGYGFGTGYAHVYETFLALLGDLDAHTRWKAAKKLGLAKVPVHVARDLSPEQIRAYRIADNQTATLAEWDFEILPIELAELREGGFDMDLLAFDEEELARLLTEGAGVQEGLTDPDDVPEPPDEAVTQPGDLWILGNHRLLCGDAGSTDDVDRLLDGAVIHLVNSDPPYNVRVEPRSSTAIAGGHLDAVEPPTDVALAVVRLGLADDGVALLGEVVASDVDAGAVLQARGSGRRGCHGSGPLPGEGELAPADLLEARRLAFLGHLADDGAVHGMDNVGELGRLSGHQQKGGG